MSRNADLNNNGKLSPDEWKGRPAAAKAGGDPAKQFARLDKDGGDSFSPAEFEPDQEERFARLDGDRDGLVTKEKRQAHRVKQN